MEHLDGYDEWKTTERDDPYLEDPHLELGLSESEQAGPFDEEEECPDCLPGDPCAGCKAEEMIAEADALLDRMKEEDGG